MRRARSAPEAVTVEEALKLLSGAFGRAYVGELAMTADAVFDVISARDDIQKLRIAIGNRFARRVYAKCPNGHVTLLYVEGRGSVRLRKVERKYEDIARQALEGKRVYMACPHCGAEAAVAVETPSRLMSEGIFSLLTTTEDIIDAALMSYVKEHIIYTAWGRHVKGLGPANMARLVALYEKAEDKRHVAKAWFYAGLAPVWVCSNKCGWWSREPAQRCPRCGAPAVQVAPTRINATIYNVEKFPVNYKAMRHMFILAKWYIVYGKNTVYGRLAQRKIAELTTRFMERHGLDQKVAAAKATAAAWRWLARMLVEHAFAVANILRGIYAGPPPPVLKHGTYIPPLVDDVEGALRNPHMQKIIEWYRANMQLDLPQIWQTIR
jgi:uncharacterized OB-fold protein